MQGEEPVGVVTEEDKRHSIVASEEKEQAAVIVGSKGEQSNYQQQGDNLPDKARKVSCHHHR